MNQQELTVLTLFLAREVARLHGLTESLCAAVQEMRVIEPRLDRGQDFAQIQLDEWQKFYEALEDLSPEIAALVDTRSPRAAGEDAGG